MTNAVAPPDPFRVLMLNSHDRVGGAARAASRLHVGLRQLGVDSLLLVQDRSGDDPSTLTFSTIAGRVCASLSRYGTSALARLPGRSGRVAWWFRQLPRGLAHEVARLTPSVVHLHWVANGCAPLNEVAGLRHPIVWTLHDMWPFTGGCHYDGGCGRFVGSCGACPQLSSHREADITRRVWQAKSAALQRVNLVVVAPSAWLAGQARASSLLGRRRIEVIPYGLDLTTFAPIEKEDARKRLGLPSGGRMVLFGGWGAAADRRKGLSLLIGALLELRAKAQGPIHLLLFGGSRRGESASGAHHTIDLGFIHGDASLALAYSAADVFVAPSREDNLPSTVMESLACGTPVVAFRRGGIPELVKDGVTGRLVDSVDAHSLAEGLRGLIDSSGELAACSSAARMDCESRFDQRLQARRYLDLYRELMRTQR